MTWQVFSLCLLVTAFVQTNMAVDSDSNDYSIDYDNQGDGANNRPGQEAIEGVKTLVNFPYSVSIQRKSCHYSSGALVSRKWVLTAAADMYNIRESIKLFKVRLGSVDCKKGGISTALKSIEIHPLYEYAAPSYDIALVKLAEAVNYTDVVKPIPLPDSTKSILTTKFLTSYWPRVIVKGHLLPDLAKEKLHFSSMRVSSQRTVPWKVCRVHMQQIEVFLNESSMCLKPLVLAHSPCLRDVGAPVVANGILWGITSGWVSNQCRTVSSPTIVTKMAAPEVHKWIDRVLFYNS